MASRAYRLWTRSRSTELDQVEQAHDLLGGTAPGRRYTTQQINRAYAVLLASQFQGFARDLHTESVDYLVAVILQPGFRVAMYLISGSKGGSVAAATGCQKPGGFG
jgi:hypothetical protein